jgi:hypothetical protein
MSTVGPLKSLAVHESLQIHLHLYALHLGLDLELEARVCEPLKAGPTAWVRSITSFPWFRRQPRSKHHRGGLPGSGLCTI